MAIYAKLAGMGAALAVGLGGGVMLAVMNPLIPNEDHTQVAPAPDPTQPAAVPDQALPAVPQDESTSGLTDASVKPAVAADDTAPVGSHAPVAPVQTGDASALADPAMTAQTAPRLQTGDAKADAVPQKMAGLSQPEASDQAVQSLPRGGGLQLDGGNVAGLIQPDANTQDQAFAATLAGQKPVALQKMLQKPQGGQVETTPDLATAPASPIVLAEPKVDLDLADVAPKVSTKGQTSALEAPQAVEQPLETQTAAKPVAPQSGVTITAPAAPPQRRLAQTQGTFKTTQSRLALNGSAGFGPTKGTSGIAALKAKTEKPEATEDPVTKIGALDKNAVAFEPDGKPLFSIVLMDSGGGSVPRDALMKMPFPLTIALPADLKNVTTISQKYRDAGIEVLALSPRDVRMSLSGGLKQEQVDEVIAKIFAQLPQAVGLVDRPEGDLQRDRQLVKAVVNRFKTTGHGLITFERGLNPVPRQAAQAGVYAGQVYKVLDRKTQGASVIKRFLDRAGQLARRDGKIVMMANSDPETVAVLVNWALSNKARGLALAPVSAVLRAGR